MILSITSWRSWAICISIGVLMLALLLAIGLWLTDLTPPMYEGGMLP